VIQFQEDLVSAQVQYLQAVINFNKALIELQRVKGSFLQDYRSNSRQAGRAERNHPGDSSTRLRRSRAARPVGARAGAPRPPRG
jgi:hypothetical protein